MEILVNPFSIKTLRRCLHRLGASKHSTQKLPPAPLENPPPEQKNRACAKVKDDIDRGWDVKFHRDPCIGFFYCNPYITG